MVAASIFLWGLHETKESQPSVFVKEKKKKKGRNVYFPSLVNELRLGSGRTIEDESEQTRAGLVEPGV